MIGEKFDQLKKREKIGLIVSLLVVALVLVDRFAVQLVVRQIEQLEEEIRAENLQLKYNLAEIAQEPKVNARYEFFQPLLQATPTEAVALDQLKARIDELARRHDLQILAMRDRADSDEEQPWMRVAVEISSFEADIDALIQFLFAIRREPHVWRVDRINLSPEPGGGLSGAMIIAQITERPRTED